MKPAIIDIAGIGSAAVKALAEHGIRTLASLSKASVEKITSIPGFSEARATQVIADAIELLGESAQALPVKAGDKKDKKSKGKGKGKKDKKGKGKGKDKGKKDKKGKGKGKNKGKGKGKGKKKGKK